ncbi:MAG: helix-turn-helix transcriptional regulator [Candidatus Binatia bacterium]
MEETSETELKGVGKIALSKQRSTHPKDYIGGIERGERNVSLINIEKIAEALKISLSELFRGV